MKENKNNPSRIRRFLLSPKTTIGTFVLAAALLLGSGIGAARAALTYISDTYTSEVDLKDIGVELRENDGHSKDGHRVSWRNYNSKTADGTWDQVNDQVIGPLLENRWNTLDKNGNVVEGTEKEFLKIGKEYPEILTVKNTGTIDEYVRVSIYKYWTDPNGEKIKPNSKGRYPSLTTELWPGYIDLQLDEENVAKWDEKLGKKTWILDVDSSTDSSPDYNSLYNERIVLYHCPLLSVGEDTKPFTKAIRIDQMVGMTVDQTVKETVDPDDKNTKYTTITTTYSYNGYSFTIEATVDAVQDHNAEEAIKSAWGIDVEVGTGSNGKKTLKKINGKKIAEGE